MKSFTIFFVLVVVSLAVSVAGKPEGKTVKTSTTGKINLKPTIRTKPFKPVRPTAVFKPDKPDKPEKPEKTTTKKTTTTPSSSTSSTLTSSTAGRTTTTVTTASSTLSTTPKTTSTTTASTTSSTVSTTPKTTSTTTASTTSSSTTPMTTSTTTTPSKDPVTCSTTPECEVMCVNLTLTGGIVQSPNFPLDYGNNRNCIVTITVLPAKKKIQLTFTTFNLETAGTKGFDYIDVMDGKSMAFLLNGVFGNTIPPVVSTTTNKMLIKFTSDRNNQIPSNSPYNWKATFTMI